VLPPRHVRCLPHPHRFIEVRWRHNPQVHPATLALSPWWLLATDLLAATRTGLTPAGDDKLMRLDVVVHRRSVRAVHKTEFITPGEEPFGL
jgi:hypothetical protein